MVNKLFFAASSAVALGIAWCCPRAEAEHSVTGLTQAQQRSGWELLFDGDSLDGWRGYRQSSPGEGWSADDGVIRCSGKTRSGDLITDKKYDAFELMLEYRISEGGNSGVMFHVTEDGKQAWHSGPEIQIFDAAEGSKGSKSGWLYQLYQPPRPRGADASQPPIDATRPAGQWNHIYLKVWPDQCEVVLNGHRYYRFKIGNDEWEQRVAQSKFSKFPGFAKAGSGHVCLQNHGDEVAFRNLKIRELGDDGSLPQPIDGKLPLHAEVAFPKLKWEGWEPIDDAGKIQALRFSELTTAKDDSNRLFAASQSGAIYVFDNDPEATEAKLFLDLQDQVAQWSRQGGNEEGLLGLAFHPNYADNGYFYVYYSDADDDKSVVSRFRVSEQDPDRADAKSETVVMEIPQPYGNHNGGSIEFGPDGYLYIGLGDGGYRNDPHANGQDLTTLLGSILRIDVDQAQNGRPYGIPDDNPFASDADAEAGRRGEIFAYGLRNPWRLAFDSETGRLWSGEVGQELIEEINHIERGGNYGWSLWEGNLPFGNRETTPASSPIDPVWEYDHGIGKSITGGRVYRSDRIPELTGKYLYADYVSGRVWALEYDEKKQQVVRNEEIIAGGTPVLAFGEDDSGEVYFMTADMKGKGIYRFERDE